MIQPKPAAEEATEAAKRPSIVKKYANRRLYNTAKSSYVTLDELAGMVRDGEEFLVYDAKTGEDITRSVLMQIILEEDSKGRNLLPIAFLRQLIGFYDDSVRAFLPRYLELSMENFARNQSQMRGYVEETFGRFFPVQQFEELARQNMAMFKHATSMFPSFGPSPWAASEEPAAAAPRDPPAAPAISAEMQELKSKLDLLNRQLDELSRASRQREKT